MWIQIASAVSEGSQLDLYERNGLYMIRVDGWELMNGAYHASEDELGRLAGMLRRSSHAAILVGGFGLGYTLVSLLETLRDGDCGPLPRITVAERSGAVLRWFGAHINPRLVAALPSGVRLVESDVAAHLGVGRNWDIIVLDVDNGPVALSTPGNAMFYDACGLARVRDSLAPAGHFLVWSSFDDLDFIERARVAGFSVTRKYIPFPNRLDQAHLLYVLSREPLSEAERDRAGLVS